MAKAEGGGDGRNAGYLLVKRRKERWADGTDSTNDVVISN
jgi:hypothetical protein